MSSRNGYIDEKLYDYILDNSLRDLPVLARLRQETQEMPIGGMQIAADQGQFMALLVRLDRPLGGNRRTGGEEGALVRIIPESLPGAQSIGYDHKERLDRWAPRTYDEKRFHT